MYSSRRNYIMYFKFSYRVANKEMDFRDDCTGFIISVSFLLMIPCNCKVQVVFTVSSFVGNPVLHVGNPVLHVGNPVLHVGNPVLQCQFVKKDDLEVVTQFLFFWDTLHITIWKLA